MSALETLKALVGRQIGLSQWIIIDAQRVGVFAQAVGSPAADPVSPFLILSLLPHLLSATVLPIDPPRATINYGLDHVVSEKAVAIGERIRARAFLEAVELIGDTIQLHRRAVVENSLGQATLTALTVTRLVY